MFLLLFRYVVVYSPPTSGNVILTHAAGADVGALAMGNWGINEKGIANVTENATFPTPPSFGPSLSFIWMFWWVCGLVWFWIPVLDTRPPRDSPRFFSQLFSIGKLFQGCI